MRRSADLKPIARGGQVYQPSADFGNLNRSGERLTPKLVGIGQASTFWGFCQAHDDLTFAPLENKPFVPTPEQAFLLAYRPLCKELYLKEQQRESLQLYRQADKGRPIEDQFFVQVTSSWTEEGVDSAIRDLRHHKSNFDRDLLTSDFSTIRFVSINLADPPDVMCSGVVQPYYDFLGNSLQDLSDLDTTLQSIAFSLVATHAGGAAVFSWRSDSDVASGAFVDSLLSLQESDIPQAIVRFALSDFENIFLRPDWWDSLPRTAQESLVDRMNDNVVALVSHDYLADDDVRPVNWTIRSIEQNRGPR